MRTAHVGLLVAFTALACDSPGTPQRSVFSSTLPVGSVTISRALSLPGHCWRTGPDTWSYTARDSLGDGVWIVRQDLSPDGQLGVFMDEGEDGALGEIDLKAERIHWFDTREQVGHSPTDSEINADAQMRAELSRAGMHLYLPAVDSATILYPSTTPQQEIMEWNGARGQLLTQLARKAYAVCDTTALHSN